MEAIELEFAIHEIEIGTFGGRTGYLYIWNEHELRGLTIHLSSQDCREIAKGMIKAAEEIEATFEPYQDSFTDAKSPD